MFESRDSQEGGQADNGHNGGYIQNKTDSRFFWLALYAQPALWIALAVLALVRLKWIWLSVVGELSFSCYFRSRRWWRIFIIRCEPFVLARVNGGAPGLTLRPEVNGEVYVRCRCNRAQC